MRCFEIDIHQPQGIDEFSATARTLVVQEYHHAGAFRAPIIWGEAASRDGGSTDNRRLTKHTTLAEFVDSTAWLASGLVDVLLKVATGHKPHGVMRSDLARRIQEAEVRLKLLHQSNR